MSEQAESTSGSGRWIWIGLVVILIAVAAGGWWWLTRARVETDDAQIDGHVTPVSARLAGAVLNVLVQDNQEVEAGTLLVEIDPRDYQVAVDRARADLAEAESMAHAASVNVPITSTTATSGVTTAEGTLEQSKSGVAVAEREVHAAQARLVAAGAIVRQRQAEATRAARDVERLRPLAANSEISQQQFDAAVSGADAARAGAEAAQAEVLVAESAVNVAEGRLTQARSGTSQAEAGLRTAGTGPDQVSIAQARAESAAARVQQVRAALAQAELNLAYTTIKAPVRGLVSRRSVEPGQVVQAGQPLLAIVSLDDLWVTANFKETQLAEMRPGQRATITVDAFPGINLAGRVHSIAGATGARFSLLPPENASGNFVKVVQRIPVKIAFEAGSDPEHRLRPGMSAVPTVVTR